MRKIYTVCCFVFCFISTGSLAGEARLVLDSFYSYSADLDESTIITYLKNSGEVSVSVITNRSGSKPSVVKLEDGSYYIVYEYNVLRHPDGRFLKEGTLSLNIVELDAGEQTKFESIRIIGEIGSDVNVEYRVNSDLAQLYGSWSGFLEVHSNVLSFSGHELGFEGEPQKGSTGEKAD